MFCGSRLVPDKARLGFRFPCDGPGRGGTFNVFAVLSAMGVAGVLGAALGSIPPVCGVCNVTSRDVGITCQLVDLLPSLAAIGLLLAFIWQAALGFR